MWVREAALAHAQKQAAARAQSPSKSSAA
jgi:hypothetical protein